MSNCDLTNGRNFAIRFYSLPDPNNVFNTDLNSLQLNGDLSKPTTINGLKVPNWAINYVNVKIFFKYEVSQNIYRLKAILSLKVWK